jgi:hypothetical protein
MDTPDVLAKVSDKLDMLGRDDAALAAQEEGVRRRRTEIQQEVAKLQAFVEVYRSLTGVDASPAAPPSAPAVRVGVKPTESISNLAFGFLSERSGATKIAEIIAWLVSIGKLSAERTHNNYSVVYATLMRDKRFTRPKAGEFALVPSGPSLFGAPLVGKRSG